MKHLKTYENVTQYKYKDILNIWKIPYKLPHTEIAAQKLGADLSTYDLYYNGKKKYKSNYIYFISQINDCNYRTISPDGSCGELWFFGENLKDINFKAECENLEPTYHGELEITNEDIEEYILRKDAEKYNL